MTPVKGANKAGIAFHACCSVFLPERTKIIINKPLESFEDLSKKTVYLIAKLFFISSFRSAMKEFTSSVARDLHASPMNSPSFSLTGTPCN